MRKTRKVVHEKSIKMIRLYFPKLIRTIEKHEGKTICA